MEADGHVQPLGLLVQREEVRVGAPLVRFQIALLQDAARAVVLGETQLLQRRLDVAGGRYAYPAQPTVRLRAAVCQPAVVAASDRELRLRRVRRLHEEERRIDDLRLRAEFVHVAQARRHVQQLTRFQRRAALAVVADASMLALAVHQPVAHGRAVRIGVGGKLRRGLVRSRLRRDEIPRAVRLVNVRIAVYDSKLLRHGAPPSSEAQYSVSRRAWEWEGGGRRWSTLEGVERAIRHLSRQRQDWLRGIASHPLLLQPRALPATGGDSS